MRVKNIIKSLLWAGGAPLWIGQALYIRRVTPRLPEPEGERSGAAGQGSSLKLLIVGDSAAAGVGVQSQQQGLAGQLTEALAADYHVVWKLRATRGQTAGLVATALAEMSPETFDVVVVSVGVNDVTHGTRLGRWTSDLKRIMDLLEDKCGSPHVIFSAIPPMHLFPALPQPLRWFIGQRARRLNQEMKETMKTCNYCELADIRFPLEEKFMASDGFHPGVAAYTLWAGQLAGMIRRWAAKKYRNEEAGSLEKSTERNDQPETISGRL